MDLGRGPDRARSCRRGIFTTETASELGRRWGVGLPITEQMHAVLFAGKSPRAAFADLMGREAKDELAEIRPATDGQVDPASAQPGKRS